MVLSLEKQVISLDLAKQLKELGVKQESLHSWHKLPERGKDIYELLMQTEITGLHKLTPTLLISAFTVAELGEMLPKAQELYSKGFSFDIENHDSGNWAYFLRHSEEDKMFNDTTEANCRAKMLCWLIENKKS